MDSGVPVPDSPIPLGHKEVITPEKLAMYWKGHQFRMQFVSKEGVFVHRVRFTGEVRDGGAEVEVIGDA